MYHLASLSAKQRAVGRISRLCFGLFLLSGLGSFYFLSFQCHGALFSRAAASSAGIALGVDSKGFPLSTFRSLRYFPP